MLWLAGLMGIVGAGAASIVITPLSTDAAEPEEDDPDAYDLETEHGDLLDQFADLRTADEQQLSSLVDDLDALGERQAEFFENTSPDTPPVEGLPTDPYFEDDFDELENDPLANVLEISATTDAVSDTSEAPIMLGDWITQGQQSEVVDYDRKDESLVLVWDDLAHEPNEPSIRVESDPHDDEVKHVVMNDTSVAEIYGDPELSAADITMIPLSSALIVGLEPA